MIKQAFELDFAVADDARIWGATVYIFINKIIDNKVVFREEEEWDTLLNWYLKHYFENFDNVCRLYDDIGYENVDKISKLASLFCNYLYEVVDMSSNRRIKH